MKSKSDEVICDFLAALFPAASMSAAGAAGADRGGASPPRADWLVLTVSSVSHGFKITLGCGNITPGYLAA